MRHGLWWLYPETMPRMPTLQCLFPRTALSLPLRCVGAQAQAQARESCHAAKLKRAAPWVAPSGPLSRVTSFWPMAPRPFTTCSH